MAGPCAVESREQLMATARMGQARGRPILRGGAFKPRTSPYSFQGLGLPALELLHEAHDDVRPAGRQRGHRPGRRARSSSEHVDMLQVGARNMPNFVLLKAVGQSRLPVLLKRGLSRDDRGVADGRRVHPLRRQPERDPVRARHPHLRDRDPQHARPVGGAGPPRPDAPAGHRRPAATAPATGPRCADGPRGRRGRRRRPDHRGPSRSGQRAVRLRPVPRLPRVRRPHGRPAPAPVPPIGRCAAGSRHATAGAGRRASRTSGTASTTSTRGSRRWSRSAPRSRSRSSDARARRPRPRRAPRARAPRAGGQRNHRAMTPVELTMVFDAILRASRSVAATARARAATEAPIRRPATPGPAGDVGPVHADGHFRPPGCAGRLTLPGDKSIAHRALIFGALARRSDDGRHPLARARRAQHRRRACGRWASRSSEETDGRYVITGRPSRRRRALDCGNSGTTHAAARGRRGRPAAARHARRRRVAPRAGRWSASPRLLRAAGCGGETTDGHAPLTVAGQRLAAAADARAAGRERPGAGRGHARRARADGETTIETPGPTRDHTERLLAWHRRHRSGARAASRSDRSCAAEAVRARGPRRLRRLLGVAGRRRPPPRRRAARSRASASTPPASRSWSSCSEMGAEIEVHAIDAGGPEPVGDHLGPRRRRCAPSASTAGRGRRAHRRAAAAGDRHGGGDRRLASSATPPSCGSRSRTGSRPSSPGCGRSARTRRSSPTAGACAGGRRARRASRPTATIGSRWRSRSRRLTGVAGIGGPRRSRVRIGLVPDLLGPTWRAVTRLTDEAGCAC